MKTDTKIALIAIVVVIIFVCILAMSLVSEYSSSYLDSQPKTLEDKLVSATMDGLSTKYHSQDPLVWPSKYITCVPGGAYDYIVSGTISLVNEYGGRVNHQFSAYLVNQSGTYVIVDSIII